MNKLNRRAFLAAAGVGSAAVTTGAALTLANQSHTNGKTLAFRAVAGLPNQSMPAYASYLVEGHVNLASRSGVLTQTLYAGDPEGMSRIAFPGQTRVVRVTDVKDLGGIWSITGVIDDRSQLRRGESSHFEIVLDHAQGLARTTLFGSELVLRLEK